MLFRIALELKFGCYPRQRHVVSAALQAADEKLLLSIKENLET